MLSLLVWFSPAIVSTDVSLPIRRNESSASFFLKSIRGCHLVLGVGNGSSSGVLGAEGRSLLQNGVTATSTLKDSSSGVVICAVDLMNDGDRAEEVSLTFLQNVSFGDDSCAKVLKLPGGRGFRFVLSNSETYQILRPNESDVSRFTFEVSESGEVCKSIKYGWPSIVVPRFARRQLSLRFSQISTFSTPLFVIEKVVSHDDFLSVQFFVKPEQLLLNNDRIVCAQPLQLFASSESNEELYALGEPVCPNIRFVRNLVRGKSFIDDYELFLWDRCDVFSNSKTDLKIDESEGKGWRSRLGSMIRQFSVGPATESANIVMDFHPTSTPSFNIFGGSSAIRTSAAGYNVTFEVGSSSSAISRGSSVTISGVTLSMTNVSLSSNALLLCFKFENSRSYTQSARAAVEADISFNGNDDAPVSNLASDRGFKIYYKSREMTFVCGSYPLVSDVSSYWYGLYYTGVILRWTRGRIFRSVLERPFGGQ
jgi:hypothetical protein